MEDTTNISELPIKSNIPHKEQDEISNQIDIGESKISMDSGIHNNIVTKKYNKIILHVIFFLNIQLYICLLLQ
jgi:hypothetical protein